MRASGESEQRLCYRLSDLIGQCHDNVTLVNQSELRSGRGKSKQALNLFCSPPSFIEEEKLLSSSCASFEYNFNRVEQVLVTAL